MKKLLILTTGLMLTASAVGCHCCDWLWRGSYSNPCPPAPTYSAPCYNPCPPAPCDPCASGPAAAAPMTVVPGPVQ